MTFKGTRVAALVAAAALAVAAPAGAHAPTKAKLKITKLTAQKAQGTLSSKDAACERGRKVVLRYAGEYGPVKIASDKTNRKGAWSMRVDTDFRGIFYATTAKTADCAAAESKDVRLR
jgi:hypothetical protein